MSEPARIPPFLRVPLEIRYLIYEHLLVAESTVDAARRRLLSMPDQHEYEKIGDLSRVVSIRNLHPSDYRWTSFRQKLRSSYSIRSGSPLERFLKTTYTCVSGMNIHPAVLGVNHQVHDEAAKILYGAYTFDFDTNVEACVPFLRDLTPSSRRGIKRVSLVKRAPTYDQSFDRLEWSNMCTYVAQNMALSQLSLGIVALKPYVGSEFVQPMDKEALKATCGLDVMEWIKSLTSIKGLQQLNVRACTERCPPPMSKTMDFFLAFSASVERGLAEYLTEHMIQQAA
jgi:hypothetical protein